MSFALTYNKIAQPSPNVVPLVQLLARQVGYLLQVAPADSARSFPTELGTLTASKRNSKPFIVGFIPPDNPVNFIPFERTTQEISTFGTRPGAAATSGGASGELAPVRGLERTSPEFQAKLIETANNLGIDPSALAAVISFETGGSFDPSIRNSIGATGLIQFLESTAKRLGTSTDELAQMSGPEQLEYVEKYYKATGKLGSIGANGDVVGDTYLCVLAPAYVGKSQGTVMWRAPGPNSTQDAPLDPQGCSISNPKGAYCQNKGLDKGGTGQITVAQATAVVKGILARAQRKEPIQVTAPSETVVPPSTETEAQRALVTSGGFTGLESDKLEDRWGRNIKPADDARQRIAAVQTEALRRQIELLHATPPLVLLINPSNFRRSYEQATDSGNKTRKANVVQTWLERPMSISCSGVTAGQYAYDVEGSGGLTNVNRIHSLSYGNLLSLVSIYRNNGVIYSGDEVPGDPGIPIIPFTIFIYYDDHIYLGSFDDFTVEDSAEKPYNMSYSFNFTVRYDQQLDKKLVDDAGVAQNLRF